MLACEDLVKTYDSGFRLGPVSCQFRPGEITVVLGKNGAGKSTFFQLITANLDPTEGSVSLDGQKLAVQKPELRRRIGYLPQNTVLPKWVTGGEILNYAARLYELPNPSERAGKSLDYWDAQSFAKRPLATLSYGMQKRIGLGLATLADPEILVLDEPHSGLDLFHVKALDDEIARRARAGKITILSTHVSAFAANVATEVLVVQDGTVRPLNPWTSISFLDRMQLIEQTFFGKVTP